MGTKNGFKYDETVRITIPSVASGSEASATQRGAGKRGRRANVMQEKLGSSEYAIYVQFMDSIYDAMIVTDLGGSILDCNGRACEFFRCETDELCSLDIFEMLYGFDALMLDRVRKNMEKGGRFVLIEAYCCRRDSTTFPAEIATNKLELGGETLICFFVRDITRRREDEKMLVAAQERLAQAERMEAAGRVAGQIAHDFNNLLTPLLCYPALIKRQLPPESEARKDLDVMASTVQRMADINQQLLMVSSRGHVEHRPMDLNAVIRSLIELVRRDSKDRIEVKLELAEDLFPVRGAEEQILRVVQNLYQNAIDAMGNSGKFTIKTENVYVEGKPPDSQLLRAGEYVKITVSDTGHGIPENIRNRIYEPFFSAQHSGAKRRGAGLGMSVVYGVVKDHGGRVDFDSEVDRGTTFTILLPAERRKLDSVAMLGVPTGSSETVLVVDDDRAQVNVISKILESLGYSVLTASSGEDAIALAERCKAPGDMPRICVLDMVMGTGMDGAETFQRLKEINPEQKAVFISGYKLSERVKYAQSLGGGAFLEKPVSIEELGSAIREELNGLVEPGVMK